MTVTVTVTAMVMEMVGGGSWCVAKIGASEEALQRALDSACGGDGGADCAPIQPDGLCFTPNTLEAHASYAFNSFYQRNARASNACIFNGASTIAQTDPSACSSNYSMPFIRIFSNFSPSLFMFIQAMALACIPPPLQTQLRPPGMPP